MKLINYVTDKTGAWTNSTAASDGNVIELSHADDVVSLQGPLTLNVSFVAEAIFSPVNGNGSAARSSIKDLYSYNLEIPAGYTWRYQVADSPIATRLMAGYRVIIRQSPCSKAPPTQAPDLPCDFGVVNQPCIGDFFPVGCEPCGSGPVRMPPSCGPSLAVPAAPGGCIRPRFFNGMFITREDLETELRYLRLKHKTTNRVLAGQGGVAWGLGVGLVGTSIRVQPGYAIDCCGNDLIVTTPYKLDVASLLSDPAVCNSLTGKAQRMSLLLEYVECPEEPRPVHGDPCVGSASACEMSRVRETVRLRLVPPRDYKPNGPIQRFLNGLKAVTGTTPGTQSGSTTNTPATVTSDGSNANFQWQFQVDVKQDSPSNLNKTASFPVGMSSSVLNSDIVLIDTSPPVVRVQVTTSGDFSLNAGQVVTQAGAASASVPAAITVSASNPILLWEFKGVAPTELQKTNFSETYMLSSWTAVGTGPQAGNTLSGSAVITFSYTNARETPLNIMVSMSGVQLTTPAPARQTVSCFVDPCCPAGTKPLFTAPLPWADADPNNSGQALDPKVLALAIAYATAVAGMDGANDAYSAAGASFATANEPVKTSVAIQQLLADLCCSFLYPGPACDAKPDGVVIGCVTVGGGAIQAISPWGGRRWVMQYPLISYWLQQIGILPPDVIASKLFSVICCLAGETAPSDVPGSYRNNDITPATNVTNDQTDSARVETVSLATYAAKILTALTQPAMPADAPMVDLTLAGNSGVHLVVPDVAPPPASTATPDRTTSLVSDAMAAPALRTAVPPLLRDFATSLAAGLTSAMPVVALTPAEQIAGPLAASGIKTVGDVLSRTPASINAAVMGKTQAKAVSDLVVAAEAKADTVAKNVADALKQTGSAHALVSTDDLASADTRAALVQAISKETQLPDATVAAAVTASLA